MDNSQREMTTDFEFTISRVFETSPERMWEAWTESEQFKRWFGPTGCSVPHCTIDLRPGGTYTYCIELMGMEIWGVWLFKEIDPLKKIVAVVSFTNRDGDVVVHPLTPDWPLEILSTVTFNEVGGKTEVIVRWSAYNASKIEMETFQNGADSMAIGWGGTFQRLETYLETA